MSTPRPAPPAEALQNALAAWELNLLAVAVGFRNVALECARVWSSVVAMLEAGPER